VRFAWIREHREEFPDASLEAVCRVLEVSPSGLHAARSRRPSARARRREELAGKIKAMHEENLGVYGSPRVHQALLAEGQTVSENTVAKIMKQEKIAAKTKRKFVPRTTDSRHAHAAAPNLLERDFTAEAPDRRWVADITYVPTDEGWLYVAAVLDLCSRKIVGWSMADHLREELAGEALEMALTHRAPPASAGLVHHSDRGVQYACEAFQERLRKAGVSCSMSRKGDCYDNAAMESFWATLKNELVHHERFATRAAAKAAIFEYIEVFYNRKRLHSSIGYQSPESFEASLT
jgi:putative transposase